MGIFFQCMYSIQLFNIVFFCFLVSVFWGFFGGFFSFLFIYFACFVLFFRKLDKQTALEIILGFKRTALLTYMYHLQKIQIYRPNYNRLFIFTPPTPSHVIFTTPPPQKKYSNMFYKVRSYFEKYWY